MIAEKFEDTERNSMYKLQDTIKRQAMQLSHPKATSYDQTPDVRKKEESPDEYRNVFQVDKERVVRSKAYRRLKHKTQVLWAPRDSNFRTRMTHTQEVAQMAETVSLLLGLNPDLTLAIAYAHDIGHPPFGHAGERALREYIKNKIDPNWEFNHHEQGVIILQKQERFQVGIDDYRLGLNLTRQVEDGILHCSISNFVKAETLEARIIAFVDDITYILHDFEEFRALGVSLSDEFIATFHSLGVTIQEKMNRAIRDICENSNDEEVKMSEQLMATISEVKEKEIEIFKENSWSRKDKGAVDLLNGLLDYFLGENVETVEKAITTLITPKQEEEFTVIKRIREGEDKPHAYINFVARMTDTFALDLYEHLFKPEIKTYYI